MMLFTERPDGDFDGEIIGKYSKFAFCLDFLVVKRYHEYGKFSGFGDAIHFFRSSKPGATPKTTIFGVEEYPLTAFFNPAPFRRDWCLGRKKPDFERRKTRV